MKQIQINGQTFVKADDIADWMTQNIEAIREVNEMVARAIEDMAENIHEWANDPARKDDVYLVGSSLGIACHP